MGKLSQILPVILCGGSGTRLWPLSRENHPKQFIKIIGDESLFQTTLKRAKQLCPDAKPLVISSEKTRFLAAEQAREIQIDCDILLEPCARNTAPAIGLAAVYASEGDILFVMPSDHVLDANDRFEVCFSEAVKAAENNYAVTFGVKPTRPETGYGYILKGGDLSEKVSVVQEFVEKPDEATAQRYCDSGQYLWNSGMFLFKAKAFQEALSKFEPEILTACQNTLDQKAEDSDFIRLPESEFIKASSISVDYAVMEKVDSAVVVPIDVRWSDVGSWDAVAELSESDQSGNVLIGDVHALDSKQCYVRSLKKFTAVVGLDDCIVVDSEDALLISNRANAQKIGQIAKFVELDESQKSGGHIPFTVPVLLGPERRNIQTLLDHPEFLVAQKYQKELRNTLSDIYGTSVLPTHSCTAAIEMAAMLLNIQAGDEVILPTYTFVSTANAFALRGAKLRFVDMRPDNFNIDESLIEAAINEKTKAIVVMHYAGFGCDMDAIMSIAQKHHIPVVEDAAQCFDATYKGKKLGTFGQFGCLSFHPTKNLAAGSGGALIINDDQYLERAKVLWQRGTNREAFLEGAVDKYTWQDIGSSFTISDCDAALLLGEISRAASIKSSRLNAWEHYYQAAQGLVLKGFALPPISEVSKHNGHIFYVIAPSVEKAKQFRQKMNEQGLSVCSHYVPLHLAPAAQKYGVTDQAALPVSEDFYQRLIRLPLYEGVDFLKVSQLIRYGLVNGF